MENNSTDFQARKAIVLQELAELKAALRARAMRAHRLAALRKHLEKVRGTNNVH